MKLFIKELREARGLSQTALAEKSGVSRPTIIDLEAGTRETTTKTLLALAEGLGVTVTQLFAPPVA